MIRKITKIGISGIVLSVFPAFSQADYTLASGDYRVTVSPKYAHTLRTISWRGHEIGRETGFYGTVLTYEPGKMVGAGHTEGGVENVLSVSLQVDGREVQPEAGGSWRGDELTLEKISRLDRSIFRNQIRVTPDGITEQKFFVAAEPQPFHRLSVNLYCWDKATTDWFAETAGGQRLDGKFSGEKRFLLRSDVKWAAIYDAGARRGILAWYPEVIKGAIHKACFWEVPGRYHKFYMMADVPKLAPAGWRSPLYRTVLRGFEDPAQLEAEAKAAARVKLPPLAEIPAEPAAPKNINHYRRSI